MIKSLDASSVARLKAGQVIVEPTSIIKELVENAIDAGATSVTVKIAQHGLDGIQVVDNGSGIDPDDYSLVAAAHTTSKLAQFEDLSRVNTLGFRGEALASICAIGRLEITTSMGSLGSKLEFDSYGNLTSSTPQPAARGTTVKVTDLFELFPVRRRDYERNFKKKYMEMVKAVQSYALIWTGTLVVEHTVNNKKSTVLRVQGTNLEDRIALIFGAKVAANLVRVQLDLGQERRLVGRISTPSALGKGQRSNTHMFYINGRPTDQKQIHKMIVGVFQEYEPHAMPLYVLDLQVPPNELDVNITPDKRDIRLLNLYHVLQKMNEELRGLFSDREGESLAVQRPAPSQRPALSSSLLQYMSSGPVRNQSNNTPDEEESQSASEPEPEPPKKQRKLPPRPVSVQSLDLSQFSRSSLSSAGVVTDTVMEENLSQPEAEDEVRIAQTTEEQMMPEIGADEEAEDEVEGEMEDDVEDDVEDEETEAEEAEAEEAAMLTDSAELNISDTELEIRPQQPPQPPQLQSEPPNSVLVDEHSSDLFVTEPQACDQPSPIEFVIPQLAQTPKPTQHISLPTTIEQVRLAAQSMAKLTAKDIQNYAIDEDSASERLNLIVRKTDFAKMRIIGQFNLGFILVAMQSVTNPESEDIFIIDQHASDEIYNFERLQRETIIRRQPLVLPRSLELSAVEELVLINNLEVFENNGFSILVDGDKAPGRQCALTALPFSKGTVFNDADVKELIYKIQDNPGDLKSIKCSKLRAMFAMRACRSSIMVGHPLRESAMRKVVDNLGTLNKPWNCPHGRPTIRHITSLS